VGHWKSIRRIATVPHSINHRLINHQANNHQPSPHGWGALSLKGQLPIASCPLVFRVVICGLLVLWVNISGARAAGPTVPEPDIPQVKLINRAFEQQWKDYALTPAPIEEDS
jgi:hypothetical protein